MKRNYPILPPEHSPVHQIPLRHTFMPTAMFTVPSTRQEIVHIQVDGALEQELKLGTIVVHVVEKK